MIIELNINGTRIRLQVKYNEEGVVIDYYYINPIGAKQRVNVPKFGCININKCTEETTDECGEPKVIPKEKIKFKIIKRQGYVFSVGEEFNTGYWYFQDGTPISSSGTESSIIKIPKTQNPLIRFIGIDEKGCFGVFSDYKPLKSQ